MSVFGREMTFISLHLVQRTFLPANLSETRYAALHFVQRKLITTNCPAFLINIDADNVLFYCKLLQNRDFPYKCLQIPFPWSPTLYLYSGINTRKVTERVGFLRKSLAFFEIFAADLRKSLAFFEIFEADLWKSLAFFEIFAADLRKSLAFFEIFAADLWKSLAFFEIFAAEMKAFLRFLAHKKHAKPKKQQKNAGKIGEFPYNFMS